MRLLNLTQFIEHTHWMAENYALGDKNTKSVINIAGNSYSSSILNMLPLHLNSAPESGYVAQEEIEVKRLDSVFDLFCSEGDRVMIKIDTQGYERNVIQGAGSYLNRVIVLQLEMSIVPLYENEMLYIEMINFLEDKGFELYSLEPGFSDPKSGRLLQVDGIFVNKNYGDSFLEIE